MTPRMATQRCAKGAGQGTPVAVVAPNAAGEVAGKAVRHLRRRGLLPERACEHSRPDEVSATIQPRPEQGAARP